MVAHRTESCGVVTVGSLFAGIGGFDLGFERAGMTTKWVVEHDPFCQFVLAKNFPKATRYSDVRRVSAANLERVDVLCGGFPCQDISAANPKATGVDGARSGLWEEFKRLVGDLRPEYVVIENSPILSSKGLDRVLSGLAEGGYDAEWQVLPAASLGAPHIRERLFVVAYTNSERCKRPRPEHGLLNEAQWQAWKSKTLRDNWWTKQPEPPRVDVGFPHRLDKDWRRRVAVTGNALVPQIAEYIGACIMADYAAQHVDWQSEVQPHISLRR